MNILSREFTKKLALYPDLVILKPAMTHTGQFVPVDLSRGIFGDPEILKMASEECAWLLDFLKIEVVCGVELAGVPLATSITLHTDRPLVIARVHQERYGRPEVVGAINFLNGTERVLLVDDMIAYGGTKISRISRIEKAGGLVTNIFVLLDFPVSSAIDHHEIPSYEYHGRQLIAQKGIHVTSLLTWKELVELQRDAGTISPLVADLAIAMLDPKNMETNENGWLTKLALAYKEANKEIPDFVKKYITVRGARL